MKKFNLENKKIPSHSNGKSLNNGLNHSSLITKQTENSNLGYSPGEFEKFMSFLIVQSVEKAMQQYFDKIPPDLLSPEDAAEILKVDAETVRRHCRRGDLKYSQIGKFMRIEMCHLKEFIKKNQI